MNRITALAATAALAASTLALAAPTQAAPAKARAYQVSANANDDVAIAKETLIKVKGRVTPKAAGQKVVLQQRVGNKKTWVVTGNAKVKANGTYKLTDKPSTPGSRQYRVLKPGSNGLAKGFSAPVDVQVYRWEKLAYRTPVATNFTSTGATIGTEYYGQSLTTVTPGTAATTEYTLGRKCTALRATYALTDQSATGSSGAITVTADGKQVACALPRGGHDRRRRGARPDRRLPAQVRRQHQRDPGCHRRRRHARGALHALTASTRPQRRARPGSQARACSPLLSLRRPRGS